MFSLPFMYKLTLLGNGKKFLILDKKTFFTVVRVMEKRLIFCFYLVQQVNRLKNRSHSWY